MNPLRSISSFIDNHLSSDPVTYTAPPTTYNVRGIPLNGQDIDTARGVMFGEISNRNNSKQELEGRTILNTALNRVAQYKAQGKTMSLHDVLSAPNQYQAYNGAEYQRLMRGSTTPVDAPKLKAIDNVILQLKNGNFPDTTDGMVYYKHDPTGRIILAPGSLYAQPRSVRDLAQKP